MRLPDIDQAKKYHNRNSAKREVASQTLYHKAKTCADLESTRLVFQCNRIGQKHTKLALLPTLYSYICSLIPYLHQMMINSKCKI